MDRSFKKSQSSRKSDLSSIENSSKKPKLQKLDSIDPSIDDTASIDLTSYSKDMVIEYVSSDSEEPLVLNTPPRKPQKYAPKNIQSDKPKPKHHLKLFGDDSSSEEDLFISNKAPVINSKFSDSSDSEMEIPAFKPITKKNLTLIDSSDQSDDNIFAPGYGAPKPPSQPPSQPPKTDHPSPSPPSVAERVAAIVRPSVTEERLVDPHPERRHLDLCYSMWAETGWNFIIRSTDSEIHIRANIDPLEEFIVDREAIQLFDSFKTAKIKINQDQTRLILHLFPRNHPRSHLNALVLLDYITVNPTLHFGIRAPAIHREQMLSIPVMRAIIDFLTSQDIPLLTNPPHNYPFVRLFARTFRKRTLSRFFYQWKIHAFSHLFSLAEHTGLIHLNGPVSGSQSLFPNANDTLFAFWDTLRFKTPTRDTFFKEFRCFLQKSIVRYGTYLSFLAQQMASFIMEVRFLYDDSDPLLPKCIGIAQEVFGGSRLLTSNEVKSYLFSVEDAFIGMSQLASEDINHDVDYRWASLVRQIANDKRLFLILMHLIINGRVGRFIESRLWVFILNACISNL